MTLMVSTALFAVPPGPASAAAGEVVCFPVFDESGNIIDEICVELLVFGPNPEPEPEPCVCPWVIDFTDHLILPVERQFAYLQELADSLVLLNQSLHSADQAEAYELRELAVDAFDRSAVLLEGERLELNMVGRYLENGEFEPVQNEWLVMAGESLASGLTVAGKRLGDPTPQPSRAIMLKQLDLAHVQLTHGSPGFHIEIRCFTYLDPDTGIYRTVCVPIITPEWVEPDDVCIICSRTINPIPDLELPIELQGEYLHRLAESLELIDRAAHLDNQDEAYQLRELAVDRFGEAALVLQGAGVTANDVGISNLDEDTFESAEQGWLWDGAGILAEVLTSTSDYLANSSDAGWREPALEQLEQVHAQLTESAWN